MRELFFSFLCACVTFACSPDGKMVEIRKDTPATSDEAYGTAWRDVVLLVSVLRSDNETDGVVTDTVPGLRLGGRKVIAGIAYADRSQKNEITVKDPSSGKTTRARVVKNISGRYSILKTEHILTAPAPLFVQRQPRVGENLDVGPYHARVYSSRLYGNRFARYTLVFQRDDPPNGSFPRACTKALPVMDESHHALGIIYGEAASASTFPPVGFSRKECEIITTAELFYRIEN